jgi:hypothetical protein
MVFDVTKPSAWCIENSMDTGLKTARFISVGAPVYSGIAALRQFRP